MSEERKLMKLAVCDVGQFSLCPGQPPKIKRCSGDTWEELARAAWLKDDESFDRLTHLRDGFPSKFGACSVGSLMLPSCASRITNGETGEGR